VAGQSPGGPGNERGDLPRRRRLAIAAACVVLVLGTVLGAVLALRATPAAPSKAVSPVSAVAAAVAPGLVDVVAQAVVLGTMTDCPPPRQALCPAM